MRFPPVIAAVVLSACGGASAPLSAPPESTSEAVVRSFMRAAADSNLLRMGDLWGTTRGPANATRFPPEYQKHLVVMQAFLRGDSVRILSDVAKGGRDNERDVAILLFRPNCIKQIPMTTVRTGSGAWLVQNVDVSAAGNPARPCEPVRVP